MYLGGVSGGKRCFCSILRALVPVTGVPLATPTVALSLQRQRVSAVICQTQTGFPRQN